MIETTIWRDDEFWMTELKKTGITERIPPFHLLTTGKEAPPSSLAPFQRDVILGGKKVDVYYWENGRGQVYLHIKD